MFTAVFVPVEQVGGSCVLVVMLLHVYDVCFLGIWNIYMVFHLYD